MNNNQRARVLVVLVIVLLCLSCSDEQTLSPNSIMEISSSSLFDGVGELSSSDSELWESSSSSNDLVESSSSMEGVNASSSSNMELWEFPSSSNDLVESSSSMEGVNTSSSSNTELGNSSSSSNDLVESSSNMEGVNASSSSNTELGDPSSSSNNLMESSSSISEYYKLSWNYLNSSIAYDTIIDSRDGQVYKVVTIGNQTWMAENLNYYDTLNLPELKHHSWCFNGNKNNCSLYGRLYDHPIAIGYDSAITTWTELAESEKIDTLNVQGICPEHFRIPTVSDYKILKNKYNVSALLSSGTNKTGFSVVVNGNIGYRSSKDFSYVGNNTNYWTVTYDWLSVRSGAVASFTSSQITLNVYYRRSVGASIRCIKDSD